MRSKRLWMIYLMIYQIEVSEWTLPTREVPTGKEQSVASDIIGSQWTVLACTLALFVING